ncbi:MAG: hypothetical protein N2Z73_03660 [Endomicrobia bacterium]|nr:hypothetical protein [Endomicrobiia bacterium]
MNILVISRYGEIVDVCRRIIDEGHNVSLFIKDKELQHIGTGIVDKVLKVDNITLKDKDLIIFDDIKWGDLPKQLRQKGYKVIGGCKITDELEEDREKFFRLCNLVGIKTPKTYTFDDVNDAIIFIKKFPNEYVLKSYSSDKSITFLSKTKNSIDLIKFLEVHRDIKKIFLQKKVRGYEVAVSCFFNGDEFVPPCIVNYEHKKFGNDNTGIFTGEMGTVLYFYPKFINFFNQTLRKFESLLKNNYVGIIDINCIVNTTGAYALELTSRFGYPITNIMSSNIISWSDLFLGLVDKKYDCVLRNLKYKNGISVGVVITAISPLENKNPLLGMPMISLNKDTIKNFSIYGLVKQNDNYYIVDKYVGVVSYTDTSLSLARQNVYALCEQMCIPDLFYYRTDIGENVEIAHKWIKGLKFFD